MRGEVALLSRNILIQGELQDKCVPSNENCPDTKPEPSMTFEQDTFGGHFMVSMLMWQLIHAIYDVYTCTSGCNSARTHVISPRGYHTRMLCRSSHNNLISPIILTLFYIYVGLLYQLLKALTQCFTYVAHSLQAY